MLTAVLDNPPRNLVTTGMIAELDALTHRLARDRSVGAVVVTAAGDGVFAQHVDVGEIIEASERAIMRPSVRVAAATLRTLDVVASIPGAMSALERTPLGDMLSLLRFDRALARMNRLDKVFVAAINGMASGAGLMIAMACDIRLVAAGDSWLGVPESRLGYLPGIGTAQRLGWAVGESRALELLVTGRLVSPPEAEAMGLVDAVVEPAELPARASELATRCARRPPALIASSKAAVYRTRSRELARARRLDRAALASLISSRHALLTQRVYVDDLDGLRPGGNDRVRENFERIEGVVDMTS